MRLVNADALIKRFDGYKKDCEQENDEIAAQMFNDCIAEIEDAPTVDAVPAVHGEWIKGYVCNQCFKHNCGGLQPYCPNCGAKMEREEK